MEKELYDYITIKLKKLAEFSIYYPEDKIKQVYISLLNFPGSLEEKKQRVDNIFDNALEKEKERKLNEQAKNGEYSNFDKIKHVISVIAHSPLAPFVTIYGGNVPYLITGKTPKRVIGDVDMGATIEDMQMIREFITQNPETFKVVIDSKDYSENDYGLELEVNGIPVTIFTHEYTPKGRIVRNFKINPITDSIDAKAILFYGIYDEETTIEQTIDNYKMRLECPEYVYIQKSVAQREKDLMDIEILKEIIDERKLQYLKSKSGMPGVLVSETFALKEKKNSPKAL
ncbi:MAG: hypothetical protein IJA94_02270 [Bacilli bacterium]|nr:hypothetical protein [Bacilli bacterium]